MCLVLTIQAKAEEINLHEQISKIPALKQGVAYSISDSNFNYLSTLDVFSWKNFSLEGGYAGNADNTGHKLVAVISYNLLNLKDKTGFPILNHVEFRPGFWVGYGSINGASLSDGEFDFGLSATVVSLKF